MKTSENRNKIMLRIIALVVALSPFFNSIGQEQIRGSVNYYICDTSIIRSFCKDTALIYNRKDKSTFMMVVDGTIPVHTWYIQPDYVNDFEIVGNMVHFCGYRMVDGQKKGIFGHFNRLGFYSDSTYYCYEVDSCAELNKIDYYSVYDDGLTPPVIENHIVMTGTTTGERSDMLVDHIVSSNVTPSPNPPYAYYPVNVYVSNDKNIHFDDVAVTDNYVAVSVRNFSYVFPSVEFWQFPRPTTTMGTNIFSSSFTRLMTSSPYAETPVFLEHKISDEYAAVYKIWGYTRMTMLQMTAPNIISQNVDLLSDINQTIIPIDIKYNRLVDDFDILAMRYRYRNDSENLLVPMQIYHVTSDVVNNFVTFGNLTRFSEMNYNLWSIDPVPARTWFVVSGDLSNLPYMFRYKHLAWQSCPEKDAYLFEIGHPDAVVKDEQIKGNSYWVVQERKKAVETQDIYFPVQCGN